MLYRMLDRAFRDRSLTIDFEDALHGCLTRTEAVELRVFLYFFERLFPIALQNLRRYFCTHFDLPRAIVARDFYMCEGVCPRTFRLVFMHSEFLSRFACERQRCAPDYRKDGAGIA